MASKQKKVTPDNRKQNRDEQKEPDDVSGEQKKLPAKSNLFPTQRRGFRLPIDIFFRSL